MLGRILFLMATVSAVLYNMDIFSTHKMNKKTLPLEFVASSHHSEGRVHCTEKLKFGSKKKGGGVESR